VLGLSILSGAHRELFPAIMTALREQGADDIVVIAGGVIPDEDLDFCKQLGIRAVFGPGTPIEDTIRIIRESVRDK
jgi:methylmalonyl-CoA mutase C-terminal domain/subunit